MKKKALSLALVIALVLSLCPWAMAAEVRETDFFEPQPHTELTFDEIEYRHIDTEPILSAMEEIRALMVSGDNEEAVSDKFDALTDQLMELATMYVLSNILTYRDVTNETYVEEYIYTYSAYLVVVDEFSILVQELLDSPCAGFLAEQLSEEDLAYYLSYEAMTDEEFALAAEEQDLVTEYQTAAIQTYTADYEGQPMDEAAVYAAMAMGALDEETGNALLTEIVKAQNAALGEIFLRMIAVRNQIAKNAGYSNYGDYAYAVVYDRDYTQKEIQAFHQAVKDDIVPAYETFATLYTYEAGDSVFAKDYSGDVALDMIEPYIGQMSSELAEALSFMRSQKMYDLGYSETKQSVGFTTMLYSYGAPFMFNQPGGDLYDFTTVVHELGHYNNYYWDSAAWNAASDNIDVAEVHSQGLELLFSSYYPEIFGSSSDAVRDYLMANLTSAMVQGCLFDELQQYIYATPNVTLRQINQQYCKLAKEYGLIAADDERTELYGWVQIPHTFENPMYYISYAVSASGAFDFWLSAQEDGIGNAVDQYLSFVALPAELGFQESFEALGMSNPLDAAYIEELAGSLLAQTETEERLPSVLLSYLFSDLSGRHWYDEYVLTMVMAGLFSGYEDATFRPASSVTWGQALKLVLMLAGYEEQAPVDGGGWASGYLALAKELGLLESDVDLNAAITRQELCRLLAMALELPASENDTPFTDTDDGYVLALTELGIITGYTDGDGAQYFNGGGSLTRAELCAILYRTVMLAAGEAA